MGSSISKMAGSYVRVGRSFFTYDTHRATKTREVVRDSRDYIIHRRVDFPIQGDSISGRVLSDYDLRDKHPGGNPLLCKQSSLS